MTKGKLAKYAPGDTVHIGFRPYRILAQVYTVSTRIRRTFLTDGCDRVYIIGGGPFRRITWGDFDRIVPNWRRDLRDAEEAQ